MSMPCSFAATMPVVIFLVIELSFRLNTLFFERCDHWKHSLSFVCSFYPTRMQTRCAKGYTYAHDPFENLGLCEQNFTCFTHLPQRFVVRLCWNRTQIVVCAAAAGFCVCITKPGEQRHRREKMPKNTKPNQIQKFRNSELSAVNGKWPEK